MARLPGLLERLDGCPGPNLLLLHDFKRASVLLLACRITGADLLAYLFWSILPDCLCTPGLPGRFTPPQYAQPAYVDATVQTATYAQPVAANSVPVTQATYTTQAAQAAPVVQQAAQPAAATGDPYGFTNWLNSTRAAYGLSAVGYDPNLSSWAAMNNDQQAARGIGHFVMGPATRQNSAMGGFPGVESMWMASPAHRAALLDPTIRWIGIAGLGAYWTFNAN